MPDERKPRIRNQPQVAVKTYSDGITAGGTKTIEFSVPSDQLWGVEKILFEGPMNCDITVKHQEEESSNDISWDGLKGYDFPLVFKKTATDVRFQLFPERSLKFDITNNEGSTIYPKVKLYYTKNYKKGGG